MDCPKCQGECWDNRAKKRSGDFKPTAPDWACRDKGCGWASFPEKKGAKVGNSGGARPAASQGAKWASYEALSVAYGKAVDIGYKHAARVAKAASLPLTLDGVLSASACVFIEASKGGVQAEPTRLPEALREPEGDGDY